MPPFPAYLSETTKNTSSALYVINKLDHKSSGASAQPVLILVKNQQKVVKPSGGLRGPDRATDWATGVPNI